MKAELEIVNMGRNCSCSGAQVAFRLAINIWDRDVNLVMASDYLWADIQNNLKKKTSRESV